MWNDENDEMMWDREGWTITGWDNGRVELLRRIWGKGWETDTIEG